MNKYKVYYERLFDDKYLDPVALTQSIEVDAETNNFIGRSSTPSGKSKGELEAVEFVDENIDKTLKIFNTYRNEFIGINILNTEKITSKLRQIDNTVGYSKIGGSIAYAISLAIADLGSKICQKPLYELINFQYSKIMDRYCDLYEIK